MLAGSLADPCAYLLQGQLKCSHTGGDVWSFAPAAAAASSAAAAAAAAGELEPCKCNTWDSKGRNPSMNVYVRLSSGDSSSSRATSASGTDSGSEGGDAEGAPRCKLGVLVRHALPQLAARLGGYGQLGLDWVTWSTEPGSTGGATPCVASVAAFGTRQEAHWRQLQELVSSAQLAGMQGASALGMEMGRAQGTNTAARWLSGPRLTPLALPCSGCRPRPAAGQGEGEWCRHPRRRLPHPAGLI